MTVTEGATFLKIEIAPHRSQEFPQPPPQSSPGGFGLRVNDDRHLSTGVCRTGKLIIGGHGKREAEALARHHQGGTEYLRDIVQIPQDEDILQAKSQMDPGGEYLYFISRHATSPGSLRNLEQHVPRRGPDGGKRGPGQGTQPDGDER